MRGTVFVFVAAVVVGVQGAGAECPRWLWPVAGVCPRLRLTSLFASQLAVNGTGTAAHVSRILAAAGAVMTLLVSALAPSRPPLAAPVRTSRVSGALTLQVLVPLTSMVGALIPTVTTVCPLAGS